MADVLHKGLRDLRNAELHNNGFCECHKGGVVLFGLGNLRSGPCKVAMAFGNVTMDGVVLFGALGMAQRAKLCYLGLGACAEDI